MYGKEVIRGEPVNLQPAVIGQPEETDRYYPIGIACLFPEKFAPCDLFRKLEDGLLVLFAGKGIPFTQESRERLLAHRVSHLYVREEEAHLYFAYLRENLLSIVKDPATRPEKKAAAVHASCKETLRWVFTDPRASFIQQAQQALSPTVDLIVADDQATRGLIRLTAYDHYTYVHSTNVGIFSIALAKIFFGADSSHDMHKLGAGFFLHDLGKCRTPIEIINKPGPLSAEERQIINRHPEDGCRVLEESGMMTAEAHVIILQHHEHDDGGGYPAGLRGGDIHPYARICRLADVYDALTSDRPYQAKRSTFEALKLMKDKILADMDQKLMDHFIRLFV